MTPTKKTVSEVNNLLVGEFVHFVEMRAGLKQYNLSAVHSFHITKKTGVEGLKKTKLRLVKTLQENQERLSAWVGERKNSLSQAELAVCRSLYTTTRDLLSSLEEQMARIAILEKWEEAQISDLVAGMEMENALPF